MARPVDERRHHLRRLHIIDAALTCFAAAGFDGATTAAICRTAGVGSGTFFHYFPTKVDVLVAILELGTQETVEFFQAQTQAQTQTRTQVQDGRDDGVGVLLAYVEHEAGNLRDERAAGFVRAVGAAATNHERVAAALADNQRAIYDALTPWIEHARQREAIRTDLSVERTVRWLMALVDGFASQVADQSGFDARRESEVLADAVRRFLAPAPPPPPASAK